MPEMSKRRFVVSLGIAAVVAYFAVLGTMHAFETRPKMFHAFITYADGAGETFTPDLFEITQKDGGTPTALLIFKQPLLHDGKISGFMVEYDDHVLFKSTDPVSTTQSASGAEGKTYYLISTLAPASGASK
jgi:hypothetical protein